MTHVTCRLTAKNRDQLRNCTLGSRVWTTFTFFYCYSNVTVWMVLTKNSDRPRPRSYESVTNVISWKQNNFYSNGSQRMHRRCRWGWEYRQRASLSMPKQKLSVPYAVQWYILMSRLVSYFSLTLLFTLCACFVDYAFVIVVIKESYYYYYSFSTLVDCYCYFFSSIYHP